jgi:hypothetical protein
MWSPSACFLRRLTAAVLAIGGVPLGLEANPLHANRAQHQQFCETRYRRCLNSCWYFRYSPKGPGHECVHCQIAHDQCLEERDQ